MSEQEMPTEWDVHYLVGAPRISLGSESSTPGPRSHILGFIHGLKAVDARTSLFIASSVPGLRRFARIPEGSGLKNQSRSRRLLMDLVRGGASIWSLIALVLWAIRRATPDLIYERLSVLQDLSRFHPSRQGALVVVESNGLMARETAIDRQAIFLRRLAESIERRKYQRADLVVAVSKRLADALVDYAGLSPDRVLVLPNAMPDPSTLPKRQPSETPTVGFVGTVVAWQRVDRLLYAADRASQALDSWGRVTVEIIGDGPDVEKLQTISGWLGVEVRFLGRLPHSEAMQRMATWWVGYCGHEATTTSSPYHSPLKLYEYASMGIPAVTPRTDDALALSRQGMPVWTFDSEHELQLALQAAIDSEHARMPDPAWVPVVYSQNSWTSRARQVLNHVAQLREERCGA